MAAFLTTHPSTAAEARAFTEYLDGTVLAKLTMPPRPQPQSQPSNGPTLALPLRPKLQGQQSEPDLPTSGTDSVSTKSSDELPATPTGNGNNGISAVSGIMPEVQNVVATANMDCRLDLKVIALHSRNAEYNPKRISAVIMRIREPKSTALIFASGKVVITGARSETGAKLAARKFTRIIAKLGFAAKFSEFQIHNVVASIHSNLSLDLMRMSSIHHYFSHYDPETFPGLIYKLLRPKVVFLIFKSGKVVITGAKTREEIHEAWEMVYPILKDHVKVWAIPSMKQAED